MKIYLFNDNNRYMENISRILRNSLEDLGHEVSSDYGFYPLCDVALFVRKPFDRQKRKGIYHILYQIELYPENKEEVDEWYDFMWDEIWDSNEVNERGIFVPIGYHPCLLFKKNRFPFIRDVGMIGGRNERRDLFRCRVRHPWEYMNTFDPIIRGVHIQQTRINLNLHAYDHSSYVEWDRIGHFLANDRFFISEKFPCDIDGVPMFKTPEEYNLLVDTYLEYPGLRKSIGERMGKFFRENYDMRKLLKKVL